MAASVVIEPPALLGVLGGGQLGMYFARAAQQHGYRVAVLDPDVKSPAMAIADEPIIAAYDDREALDRFAGECAGVTVEFESVPAASVAHLAAHTVTAPGAESIAVLQDRIREKRFLGSIGLPVAPYVPVLAAHDVGSTFPFPAILKRAREGYDGKGQIAVADRAAARAAWVELGRVPCVLERRLQLDLEVSVVVARGRDGALREFPVVENRHRGGVLECSIVPARISTALAEKAVAAARRIAECLDYVGVLGVEFFVSNAALLVNEIAPRPHNSGHFSIDACRVSQFEQQVRALCGLPLGDPGLKVPAAAMVNILGDAWRGGPPDWARVLGDSGGRLHLYGKTVARAGRKMGHITILGADAAAQAEQLLARLYETSTIRTLSFCS